MWRFSKIFLEILLKIDAGQNFRTIFKMFNNLNKYTKILRVTFKEKLNIFVGMLSSKKILGMVWENVNEILKTENLRKICGKTVQIFGTVPEM